MTANPTLEPIAKTLKILGVHLESRPGEYRLSYLHDPRRQSVYVESLTEVLQVGLIMGETAPPAPPPPIGPTGRRKGRKGAMYRHNAKIAAKRLKQLAHCGQRAKTTTTQLGNSFGGYNHE